MNISLLLILGGASLAVGLLLYVPFLLWFRKRRMAGRPLGPGGLGQRVPADQLLWSVVVVGTLLVGLAAPYIAPETWLGATLSSGLGRVLLYLGLMLIAVGAPLLLNWARRRTDAQPRSDVE